MGIGKCFSGSDRSALENHRLSGPIDSVGPAGFPYQAAPARVVAEILTSTDRQDTRSSQVLHLRSTLQAGGDWQLH